MKALRWKPTHEAQIYRLSHPGFFAVVEYHGGPGVWCYDVYVRDLAFHGRDFESADEAILEVESRLDEMMHNWVKLWTNFRMGIADVEPA